MSIGPRRRAVGLPSIRSARAAFVRWVQPADIPNLMDPAYAVRVTDALTRPHRVGEHPHLPAERHRPPRRSAARSSTPSSSPSTSTSTRSSSDPRSPRPDAVKGQGSAPRGSRLTLGVLTATTREQRPAARIHHGPKLAPGCSGRGLGRAASATRSGEQGQNHDQITTVAQKTEGGNPLNKEDTSVRLDVTRREILRRRRAPSYIRRPDAQGPKVPTSGIVAVRRGGRRSGQVDTFDHGWGQTCERGDRSEYAVGLRSAVRRA